ncbi:TonB-dependent receptor [Niabella drilacis]|uniref:Iron complex outermembrane recepter protein n=1 Tax=Niabella drilacis (strain DSM 25811 / CCM 8410 / CCUG 62505 / LMG 26954 / E90) TaxID=1285928 RepID=A0A1G6M1B0_NIADE|nr:TonB-dependent receptor plug domain-containing protein [Niabella drilacis]SDC48765.1 iron complex outermembrane recepter protein [Niabella drilacis]
MKRIFFSGCLVLAAQLSFAQKDSVTAKTDSFYLLSPVEVRSLRLSSKAPFTTTNIHSADLQKQNLGQNMPYLLNQTPSLVVNSDDGVGVGYSSLRIRGTDMTRINVTMNGIPINDAESQAAIFVDLPDLASSTTTVQIQRGVGSSTNGSGAFGGSINISNLEQSKTAGVSLNNSYGSFNTWKHTLQAGTGLLKGGFQFDARLSRLSSSGFVDRASSDLLAAHVIGSWTSKNEATNIRFNYLTGKERTGQAWNGLGIAFTDQGQPADYQKELEQQGRNTNTLGEISEGVYYKDQTDNYWQDYYQLFLNQKISNHWDLNIGTFLTRGKGYYNEYKKEEKFADYGLPDYVKAPGDTLRKINLTRQLWLDNYYYGSVFSTTYNTAATNFVFGGAYTQYDARHYGFVKWAAYGVPLDYRWYNLTAFKTDFNLYTKLQQQLFTNFYGFADLQYRNVVYTINGFRKSPALPSMENTYRFFNPKAGLSYFIYHGNNVSSKIYASYAIAHKEPNRDDFEASENEKPRTEQLQDIEAGYQYHTPTFQAGINGYYMDYKDQLILTGKINDVGAYARTNVPDSYRAGLEFSAGLQPLHWLQLNANATFSKNKIRSLTQYADDYDNGGQLATAYRNTDISFSPNTIAGAGLTLEPLYRITGDHHFFIDFLEKYVSRQYLDNASDKRKSIHPYALTDLRLRYQASSKIFKSIGILLMINNVFDKKYENNGYTFSYRSGGTVTTENYYFPQAGINWNIGLSFGF